MFMSTLFDIHIFWNFLVIFLLLLSSLILLWYKSGHFMVSILLYLLNCAYGSEFGLSWCMVHVNFRKICILLLFDGVYHTQVYWQWF